jgi:hypothetical protein
LACATLVSANRRISAGISKFGIVSFAIVISHSPTGSHYSGSYY